MQLPAILKAKEKGLYVGVVDYDPEAIGIKYADEYFNVSTIDEVGVCEATKKFGADGIMTLATDMPMRAVAYTCCELGLHGISYETAVKATDKGEMIKAFEAADVAHPWYYIIDCEDALDFTQITYPCISKPTDNSGSRGVMVANDETELRGALQWSFNKSRGGKIIVEEYMQGPEVSVEVMVLNGVPHILRITDKLTTNAPHFVEMGHNQPSLLSDETQKQIRELASKAVLSVGILNGPAHVEIIVTETGPKMVELGARMGGDCITTHLVPLSSGIDMVEATIDLALGYTPDIATKFTGGAAIRFMDAPVGMITEIAGVEKAKEIPGVIEVSFTKGIGAYHKGVSGGSGERIGFVIAQAADATKAIEIAEKALATIKIVTDGSYAQPEAVKRTNTNMSTVYGKNNE